MLIHNGDIVTLKSGSPEMTVTLIESKPGETDQYIHVVGFDKNDSPFMISMRSSALIVKKRASNE